MSLQKAKCTGVLLLKSLHLDKLNGIIVADEFT